MRAGDVFMNALAAEGVSCIFGNPGTTENAILDRLVDHPELSYYTTLHEGVAVAAATFHAMATGTPGVVNLHVAPGLGNAIGLMFGALKAGAPLVVTAGQQDTRMRLRQTLFSHDLVGMAAPVTKWSVEPRHGDEVAAIVHRAFEVAREPPCGPVFISLPVDVMEHETAVGAIAERARLSAATPDAASVEGLADLLRSARCPAIVVGDDVAAAGALTTVVELAERIGACTYREIMHARLAFPTGHPSFRGRLPFDARNIRAALAAHDTILLVGGQFFEEMWFEEGSPIPHTARVARIEASRERLSSSYRLDFALVGDIAQTLSQVLDALVSRTTEAERTTARAREAVVRTAGQKLRSDIRARLDRLPDTAPMSPMRVISELTRILPHDAVLVDESLTAALMDFSPSGDAIASGAIYSSLDFGFQLNGAGDFYSGRGGGLGQAMPGALGLQIAHPERRVVALIGDGSGMYSVQSLWTAAHYRLPILFIIFANREYRVLKHNLDIYRHRFGIDPGRPYLHMDLSEPQLSYPQIAKGMGVDGESVSTPEKLSAAIRKALASDRPYLIEVEISGKAPRVQA